MLAQHEEDFFQQLHSRLISVYTGALSEIRNLLTKLQTDARAQHTFVITLIEVGKDSTFRYSPNWFTKLTCSITIVQNRLSIQKCVHCAYFLSARTIL